jgi:hypothetical protein
MELDPHPGRLRASTASSKFFQRDGLFRSNGSGDATRSDGDKGPLGLVTVHRPSEKAAADLVFIHGLGGGSK